MFDSNINILALIETWLHPENVNDRIICNLTPIGYSFYHSLKGSVKMASLFIFMENDFTIIGLPAESASHQQDIEFLD